MKKASLLRIWFFPWNMMVFLTRHTEKQNKTKQMPRLCVIGVDLKILSAIGEPEEMLSEWIGNWFKLLTVQLFCVMCSLT